MSPTHRIVRGGITIERSPTGNITIFARGNGSAIVQRADIKDLIDALDEVSRIDPNALVTTLPDEEPTDPGGGDGL